MAVGAAGVQLLHGGGQVAVSGGGAVALGDPAGGGGGRVDAQLAVQVLEGGDVGVVAVHHQAVGVLSVGDGAGVLLLAIGVWVHAADDHVIAAGVQAGQHGVPAVGGLELHVHAQAGADLTGHFHLEAGEVAGAVLVVHVGDPVALVANGQHAGVQNPLQGAVVLGGGSLGAGGGRVGAGSGGLALGRGGVGGAAAAGGQGEHQRERQRSGYKLLEFHSFHLFLSEFFIRRRKAAGK